MPARLVLVAPWEIAQLAADKVGVQAIGGDFTVSVVHLLMCQGRVMIAVLHFENL